MVDPDFLKAAPLGYCMLSNAQVQLPRPRFQNAMLVICPLVLGMVGLESAAFTAEEDAGCVGGALGLVMLEKESRL